MSRCREELSKWIVRSNISLQTMRTHLAAHLTTELVFGGIEGTADDII
jgi:hypothetical protein